MAGGPYLLGYDIGSSSIKASLLDAGTGALVASASSPDRELEIIAKGPGWAEQDPAIWWEHAVKATAGIRAGGGVDLDGVAAVGISYQMHGLVIVDHDHRPLRPAIIWCDSRAVSIGDQAFRDIGEERCLERLLNSPGNFTASKLKWVMENEPDIYRRAHKMMLPGEAVAMMMTGEIRTTPSGLSEGILWDFHESGLARLVLDHYGIDPCLVPEAVPTFSHQGGLTVKAARTLGLRPDTPVSYRAGDQPNNALSLKVLEPGEVAANAGTSGVIYGVTDHAARDERSRVNTFVHVNHAENRPRYGILLCVNGTGILLSWIRHSLLSTGGETPTYERMNAIAARAPIGCEGLIILPFGNGAERTLGNRNIGASMEGLDFNIHGTAHLLRAAQEGIVYAMGYGLAIMREMGADAERIRAGHANLFLSPLFRSAFANVSGAPVEIYDTDGAQGAARGAGLGAGLFGSTEEAFAGLEALETVEPDPEVMSAYEDGYHRWVEVLEKRLIEERENA